MMGSGIVPLDGTVSQLMIFKVALSVGTVNSIRFLYHSLICSIPLSLETLSWNFVAFVAPLMVK